MGFADAVKTCLRNYATFSGRARRPECWWFVLFVGLGSSLFAVADRLAFGLVMPAGPPMGGGVAEAGLPQAGRRVFTPLFQLATLVPLVAVGWRRMHDTGRSGWLLLLPLALLGVGISGLIGAPFGIGVAVRHGFSPESMAAPAADLGAILGLAVFGFVQLVVLIALIWWLTRPTQPGENRFGLEPPPN